MAHGPTDKYPYRRPFLPLLSTLSNTDKFYENHDEKVVSTTKNKNHIIIYHVKALAAI